MKNYIACVLPYVYLSQTEDRIRETLTKYIDGSTGGQQIGRSFFFTDLIYYVRVQ
jgi:hypothetical protein